MSITPDQFQTVAEAWIGAGVAVVITLTSAAAYVLPKIAALKSAVDSLKGRADSHDQQITSIALATPVPLLPEHAESNSVSQTQPTKPNP